MFQAASTAPCFLFFANVLFSALLMFNLSSRVRFHVSCSPLWWPPVPEVHPSFEFSWVSEDGLDLAPASQQPMWNLATGEFTMSASWDGLDMCEVHYNVTFEPLLGDFDVDGAIGTSDLLVMLSSIGCTSECIQDFNADLSVTVMDLLVFLTVLGQTCD